LAVSAALGSVGCRCDLTPSALAEPERSGARRILILYDTTGPWGHLGEINAIKVANLASHFGTWRAKPVREYRGAEIDRYSALIYIGSTYDEPVPDAFVDDVLRSSAKVIWLNSNIWRLSARNKQFAARYGWQFSRYEMGSISEVRYKGRSLRRDPQTTSGIAEYKHLDPQKATILALAVRPNGTTLPWAIRSRNLTYIGEIPFSYAGEADRMLIFFDLLFETLAPKTPERHRALVRIEDIGPASDPKRLRALGEYLGSQKIPFGFGVYPVYFHPKDPETGLPTKVRLSERPELVRTLRQLVAAGGTLILHGYTHQYSNVPNPYTGSSGADFEFYRVRFDPRGAVRFEGPVAEDSATWVISRLEQAKKEIADAGLPAPTIFEFPHYAGSPAAYRVVGAMFRARYERGMYFKGLFSGGVDYSQYFGQFFPFVVTDVYGTKVIPENLGNYGPATQPGGAPSRPPQEILKAAAANLVVRDGVASFFYHCYLDLAPLRQIVEGIRSLGYEFVSPSSL
jgi:uncharacterized protein YdaL